MSIVRGPWPRENRPPTRSDDDHDRPRPGRRSPAWAHTARPSAVHCDICGRVFAAGHLPPADGPCICRDCRDDLAGDPTLFDPDDDR